jgi:hypothetical protein
MTQPYPDDAPRDSSPARLRGDRLAALAAVALFVLSCGLLKGMADDAGGPPVQSMGVLFGPAPAVAPDPFLE